MKAYAKALGLDSLLIVEAFKAEIDDVAPSKKIEVNVQAQVIEQKRFPSWTSAFVGLVGAFACWAWFYGGSSTEDYSNKFEINLEERQLAEVTAKIERFPDSANTELLNREEDHTPLSTEVNLVSLDTVHEMMMESPNLSFSTAVNASEAKPAFIENDKLKLYATEDSWLSLTHIDGTEVWSGILRAGQTYQPASGNVMIISASNAGGLVVTIDGTETTPLGEHGDVITNLQIDLKNYASMATQLH